MEWAEEKVGKGASDEVRPEGAGGVKMRSARRRLGQSGRAGLREGTADR